MIIAAKGGMLADITPGDVLEVLDAEHALRGRDDSAAATFRMLQEMGIFGPDVPALREILDAGQRTVEELVDRYPIACRPVRDLLVDYLKERQPAIDYVTLRLHFYELASCFWADIERHHPGHRSRCTCPPTSLPPGNSGWPPRPPRPQQARASRPCHRPKDSATSTRSPASARSTST